MNPSATRHTTGEIAWRELEARLRPFIASRVAAPADVDDVLQDVFMKLSHSLPVLRDESRLVSWLFTVARNALADHRRQRQRHPLTSADVAESIPDEDSEHDVLGAELVACVARFITLLPDEYRQAITLVELERVSQKDAAAMLGLSHSGMKSRVQRGRAALRAMFEQACGMQLDARRKVIACEPRSCECRTDPNSAD